MTSYIIDTHITRKTASDWKPNTTFCVFCRIIQDGDRAYKVYENENVIAILGHVLVIPKPHYQRLSDLPADVARATGEAVSKVANALTKAMDNTALNVVCNQEYAQAVPHVHYHIVPAPTATASIPLIPPSAPPSTEEMHRREFLAREELDEDDAEVLMRKIRSKL